MGGTRLKWLIVAGLVLCPVLSVRADVGGNKKPATSNDPIFMTEWHGLNTIDRKYAGKVECKVQASIVKDGTGLPLLVEEGDTVTASAKTIGESLSKACELCAEALKPKRKRLAQDKILRYRDSCFVQSCTTKKNRLVEIEPRIFDQVKTRMAWNDAQKCVLKPAVVAQAKSEAADHQTFSKIYSRPNDDPYQNSAGALTRGEPYEVAVMYAAIVGKKQKNSTAVDLFIDWRAEMVTGRHVESVRELCFHEESTNLPGQKPKTVLGEEDQEKIQDFFVKYPPWAGKNSNFEEKVGTVVGTMFKLGTADKDGRYEGEVNIRLRTPAPPPPDEKPPFAKIGPAPKKIKWAVTLKDGKITEPFLFLERRHPPAIKLVDSNFETVDRTKEEHRHYLEQEPRALCKGENVGDDDALKDKDSITDELSTEVGKLIQQVGCLDCHGEGWENNFRFCDSGVSIYPTNDSKMIRGFMENGVPKERGSGPPYPKEMVQGIEQLKKLDAQKQLIKQWAEANERAAQQP